MSEKNDKKFYKELEEMNKQFRSDPVMLNAHIKMLELKCEAWEEECKSLMFFLVEARATSKYMDSDEFKAIQKGRSGKET